MLVEIVTFFAHAVMGAAMLVEIVTFLAHSVMLVGMVRTVTFLIHSAWRLLCWSE